MSRKWRSRITATGFGWLVAIMLFGLVSFLVGETWLPEKQTVMQTAAIAATLVAITWYCVETRRLRFQQQWDNEIRNHPWLKGSDLVINRDDSTARLMGLVASEAIYLPVKNVGTTPAYELHLHVQWEMKGPNPAKGGREAGGGMSLAPGDTCHAKLCDLEFNDPADRAVIDVETEYRSFMGGGGRLKMTFYSHEKGWANGPTSPYEFWLSDGRRFPASVGADDKSDQGRSLRGRT